MRVAAGIFAAVFLLGAAVQWNDPDPFVWIAGYLAAAGLSLAACLGRRWRVACGVAAGVYGLWFLTLASSLPDAPEEAFTSFRMQSTSHEEPREAVGLALMAVWNGALAVWAGAARGPSGSAQSR